LVFRSGEGGHLQRDKCVFWATKEQASANKTGAECGQGKVSAQSVFKEEDNFVLSFPERVIYFASG